MIHRDALWILKLRKEKVSKMTMKTKKTLHRFAAVAAVLLAFCLVFMMPAAADDTPVNKAVIGNAQYNTLTEALNQADEGAEITIYGTVSINEKDSIKQNVVATIIGATDEAKIDFISDDNWGSNQGVDNYVTISGGKLTFKNLILNLVQSDGNCRIYIGFAHTSEVTYEECTIKGQLYEYAPKATYTKCTFCDNNQLYQYNIYTYGSEEVLFDGCTFSAVGGRGLLVYKDGNHDDGSPFSTKVRVVDCTFEVIGDAVSAGAVTDEKVSAIEIDTFYTTGISEITIENSTYTDKYSGLVRHKLGEHAKITIINTISFDANGGSGTMDDVKAEYSFTADEAKRVGSFGLSTGSFVFPRDAGNTNKQTELPACTFTAPTGKVFDAWDVNGESKNPGESILVLKDTTVKALWKAAPTYSVTVTANPANGGTVTADPNTAVEGADIGLTAAANDGYEFKEWKVISGGVNIVEDKFTMPASDVSLEAIFEEKKEEPEYTPTGGATDTGSGNYQYYPREVPADGILSFGTSKVIIGMELPVGSDGTVTLNTKPAFTMPENGHYIFAIDAPGYNTEAKINGAILFKLRIAEIEKAGWTEKDVVLFHGTVGEDGTITWEALPTNLVKNENGIAYYKAAINGCSPFYIGFVKDATIINEPVDPVTPETPETPVTPDEPEVLPPVDTPETPEQPTESPAPILAVLAGLGAAVVLRRK